MDESKLAYEPSHATVYQRDSVFHRIGIEEKTGFEIVKTIYDEVRICNEGIDI